MLVLLLTALIPPTGDSSKRLAAFVHFSDFTLKTFFQRVASIPPFETVEADSGTSDSSTTAKERILCINSLPMARFERQNYLLEKQ